MLIIYIAIGLWLLSAAIYVLGVLFGKRELQEMGTGGIAGVLIGLMVIIIVSIFELAFWGLLIFIAAWLILIPLFRSAGIDAIYAVSIFVLVIGYLFAGPYSGFAKSYVAPLAAPIGMAIDQLWITSYDLFLMATDPQAYMTRQTLSNVQTEKATVDYPKGLEFKKITILPNDIPSDQEFYIQVYAQNDGEMDAVNAMLSASCSSKLCCVENICDFNINGTTTYYFPAKDTPTTVKQHEVMLQRMGPFTAMATSQRDIGKNAYVNVTIHYAHSTSSRLLLTIMQENEANRILTDPVQGDSLFETIPSVGKNSPGMVALTVGYQPLYNNKNETLIVSVVNKRPKGSIILSRGTELNISLPEKLGTALVCGGGPEVSCYGDGQNVSCEVNEDMKPITPFMKYYPFTCTFQTAVDFETKVTDVITARLSGYTFEQTERVGPRITMSYKPFASTTTVGSGTAATTTTSSGGAATTTSSMVSCPSTCNYDYAHTILYIKPLSEAEKTGTGVYVCNDNTNCGCTLTDHPSGCLSA